MSSKLADSLQRNSMRPSTPPAQTRENSQPLVSMHSSPSGYDMTFNEMSVQDMQRASSSDMHRYSHPWASASEDMLRSKSPDESEADLLDVPPLGPEFTKEEHEQMTRKYKRRAWRKRRREAVVSWSKGRGRVARFCGPKVCVACTFAFLVVLGVVLYFVIPRKPTLSVVSKDPIKPVPNKGAMTVTTSPTGFNMNATLLLHADNSNGWIPSHVSDLHVDVELVKTKDKVGSGDLSGISIAGRKESLIHVPLIFSHKSLNATGDDAQLAFTQACAHLYQGTERPSLNLNVKTTLGITGSIGKSKAEFPLNNWACPFEMPN